MKFEVTVTLKFAVEANTGAEAADQVWELDWNQGWHDQQALVDLNIHKVGKECASGQRECKSCGS
jgi:hypothetical protein